VSRNTIRRILREPEREADAAASYNAQTLAPIEDAFRRAGGNAVRPEQLLAEESNQRVPYSTLTRWIGDAELRALPRRTHGFRFKRPSCI
jgi:hypothetical protein